MKVSEGHNPNEALAKKDNEMQNIKFDDGQQASLSSKETARPNKPRPWSTWPSVVATACLILAPTLAQAAGIVLAPRGVRPLARGGAFVAGANDVNALTYNPAGLSGTGNTLLLDAAMPIHRSKYKRTVAGGDGGYDAVVGRELGVPSPTGRPRPSDTPSSTTKALQW
jgi:hypothetical protein